MKVILITDVPKVGNKGDVKNLKDGYAQNVLIARNLAILATPKALADLEAKKLKVNEKKEEEAKDFDSLIKILKGKKIKIQVKANDKGHLFKAVSASDIVNAIKKEINIIIEENSLALDHIKELGVHTVILKKGKTEGKFNIEVVS